MGIGFVLLLYLILFSVLATIGRVVFRSVTSRYLRQVNCAAKTVKLAGRFPLFCALFAGLWFVGYAVINEMVFDRDPMIGDSWSTDVGNGYEIMMIDVDDEGWLRPIGGTSISSPSVVGRVKSLQVAGSQIYGTRNSESLEQSKSDGNTPNIFFALDTKSHSVTSFASEPQLALYAKQQGTSLVLRPIADVYSAYRTGSFDRLSEIVFLAVPLAAFGFLVRRIVNVKRIDLTNTLALPDQT